jgi:PKD repeat protein
MSVAFQDQSDVPAATAWHWDFGDDAVSDERNPVHQYKLAGSFDVRLTVTGAGGEAVCDKTGFIVVQPPERPVTRVDVPFSTPRRIQPRP